VPQAAANSLAVVRKVLENTVTVQTGPYTYLKLHISSIDFDTDAAADETPQCDPEPITEAQKPVYLSEFHGQSVRLFKSGSLLSDVELIAGLQEIRHRLCATRQGLFVWLPSLSQAAINLCRQNQAAEFTLALRQLSEQIDGHRCPDGSVVVLIPVHSIGPQHWTLLSLQQMQPGQLFSCVQYSETLLPESTNARLAAQQCLSFSAEALGQTDLPTLPARHNVLRQADGWSCGIWTLLYAEQFIRQKLLLQPRRPTPVNLDAAIRRMNSWIQKIQAMSPVPASLPPLPPPPGAPPPPNPPSPTDKSVRQSKKQTPKMPEIDTQTWGCSRCRWGKKGCITCNPGKAEQYLQKQK
jgi:hypothetical protein